MTDKAAHPAHYIRRNMLLSVIDKIQSHSPEDTYSSLICNILMYIADLSDTTPQREHLISIRNQTAHFIPLSSTKKVHNVARNSLREWNARIEEEIEHLSLPVMSSEVITVRKSILVDLVRSLAFDRGDELADTFKGMLVSILGDSGTLDFYDRVLTRINTSSSLCAYGKECAAHDGVVLFKSHLRRKIRAAGVPLTEESVGAV